MKLIDLANSGNARRLPLSVNIGAQPNDRTGEGLRSAFSKTMDAVNALANVELPQTPVSGIEDVPGLPEIVDALQQAVGQPKRLTFSTLAQARATRPALSVDILTILGEGASGDGRGGDYSRVSTVMAGRLSFRTSDGQLWQEVRLSPQFLLGQLQAKMHRGDVVRIACFGDSQTDGNSTTGWIANAISGDDPQGGVIPTGNNNHTDEALQAWPAQMRTILRDMYRNAGIQVWNAGYQGQQMNNGWALRQFDRAVTSNPAYGTPDAVTVMFGANDIATADNVVPAAQVVQAHIDQTRIFCRMLLSRGILPILMIGIPIWTTPESGLPRSHVQLSRQINAAKAALAQDLGLPLISLDEPVRRWLEANDDTWRWHDQQNDGLHGGNGIHTLVASYVASRLFRDIVEVSEGRPARVMNYDSRSDFNGGPSFQHVDLIGLGASLRQGSAPYVAAGAYTAGQEITRLWIWNEAPDATLIYRHTDNDLLPDRSKSTNISVLDVISGTVRFSAPPPNTGFATSPLKAADRPAALTQLAYGLNKVSMTAPADTSQAIRYGFFEVVPGYAAGPKQQPYNLSRSGSNALKHSGPIFDVANPSLLDPAYIFAEEAPDGSNVMSFGQQNKAVALLLDAQIDRGRGLCFLMGRGFSGDFTARFRVGAMLYRTIDNKLRLDLIGWKLNANGSVSGDLINLAVTAAGAYTATGFNRLRIDCIRDTGNRQVITVGTSWAGGSTLLTYTAQPSNAVVPWAGHFGDMLAYAPEFGGDAGAIEVRTAKIIHG